MQDPSIDEEIARDIALGQKKGVNGTPSIFLTTLNKEQPKYPYVPYRVLKDYFDSIVK
jgi:protein-disulfide isomerase